MQKNIFCLYNQSQWGPTSLVIQVWKDISIIFGLTINLKTYLSCSKLSLHVELIDSFMGCQRRVSVRGIWDSLPTGACILIGAQVNSQLLGNSVIVSKEVKWVNEWL